MVCWNKICGFIAIFLLGTFSLHAQTLRNVRFDNYTIQKERNTSLVSFSILPVEVIPQNYYTQHFGYMCKKELAVEKFTKIPFRFRLGSLQQCNYYEGKK